MTPDERWIEVVALLVGMSERGWQVQRYYGSGGSPTKQEITIVFVRPEQPEVKA